MKTCLVLFVLATFTNGQFPPFIKLCKRNSNINECVKENILIAKRYVKQGIPKLFVRPTNPFKITKIAVETPILNVEMTDFNGYGMDQFDIKNLNIDLENSRFDIDVNIKSVQAKTIYKLDGKVIGIPLKSQGSAIGNMTNMRIKLSLYGRRSERNGQTYINFENKKVKLAFDEGRAFFDNLFPNRDLTEVTNQVFNQNIKEVVYEMQPIFEETFIFIISDSITKLFEKFSIDELFPM